MGWFRGTLAVALLLGATAACSDDDSSSAPAATDDDDAGACDWPMWGRTPERSFATDCATALTAEQAPTLTLDWRFETSDVVTASPAVVGGVAYVGDWSGRFYAIDVGSGEEVWHHDFQVHPTVYAGQVVSSAAVVDGMVYVGAGRTLYALDASSGDEAWSFDVHPVGGDTDPSEIQSSPVVVDGLVVFGYDGHDDSSTRSGVVALDAATGDERWRFDPDGGGPTTGCAGVWGSPTVDAGRRHVYIGTANCNSSPDGWTEFSEAIVALDLDSGEVAWTFQPHAPNNDDYDFAGAPNLFVVDGVDAVGLGNKDGHYYAVERATGELLWDVAAAEAEPFGPNYSGGGFIGATAVDVDAGVIVGGTAVGGDCPCLHGIGTDGDVRWQQAAAGPTYASTAIAAGEVAVVGSTTDFTLRAVRVSDGSVLWSEPMPGAVAGGVALVADGRVVAVSGIREPGSAGENEGNGVSSFVPGEGGATTTTAAAAGGLPPTTMAPPPGGEELAVPGDARACVAAVCDVPFELKQPPPGTSPAMTLHVRPAPYRLEVRTEGLGPPEAWLRPGGEAAADGAVAYAVFASVSDDNPRGSLLCILDGGGDCVTTTLPSPLEASYSRVSLLAIEASTELPAPAEGFDRLVTTQSFTPPLELG